jgi:hypothetical protein
VPCAASLLHAASLLITLEKRHHTTYRTMLSDTIHTVKVHRLLLPILLHGQWPVLRAANNWLQLKHTTPTTTAPWSKVCIHPPATFEHKNVHAWTVSTAYI